MNQDLVYTISPSGQVEGLYRDDFNLSSLGKQKIQRATDIAFNEDAQNWDIFILPETETTEAAMGFCSYEEARRFEVEWLNECRERRVKPLSSGGRSIAFELRNFGQVILPEEVIARQSQGVY